MNLHRYVFVGELVSFSGWNETNIHTNRSYQPQVADSISTSNTRKADVILKNGEQEEAFTFSGDIPAMRIGNKIAVSWGSFSPRKKTHPILGIYNVTTGDTSVMNQNIERLVKKKKWINNFFYQTSWLWAWYPGIQVAGWMGFESLWVFAGACVAGFIAIVGAIGFPVEKRKADTIEQTRKDLENAASGRL